MYPAGGVPETGMCMKGLDMFTLTLKYTIFAIIAIALNLATQKASLWIYNGKFGLLIAVFFGTLAGLVIKYFLDKAFIFYYNTKNIKEDGQKFILYSIMGVLTTLIFWGFEFGFNYLFDFESAKFLGAIIGLSTGYLIKYQLDKKFVFKK